jgi:ribonuclease PH
MSTTFGGVDRRRNAGPEVSVRPLPDPSIFPTDTREIFDENYTRRDGRYPEQLSHFTIKTGVITRAAGSTYVECGNTKLFCTVYGPRSATARSTTKTFQTIGNVSCELNYAPFSARQRYPHQPEVEEEDLALLLLQAVCPAMRRDLFPNSYLDITVTVLEHDGSILSSAINAASLALITAGIEMLDSVVACSTVSTNQRVSLMAPDRGEEKEIINQGGSMITVALMPNINQITQLHLIGAIDGGEALSESISSCSDGIRAIYENAIRPSLESVVVEFQ